MQKNDFVKISYEGKIKETGQLFDSGKNVGVVAGGSYVIPGLDEILLQMNVGEKRTVDIQPEKAFGQRDQAKVHTVPEAEFKKHGTTPKPGLVVDADNMRGRVVSVTSGRVMIDFNHPLAGKVLTYDIEVTGKIEKPEEKILAIVEYFTKTDAVNFSVKVSGKESDITVPPIIHPIYKKKIADEIIKFLDMEKVKFSEVFEKHKHKE
jgi:FKBP-type peptidyl-prolyl cis-trans isomerase SlyD